MPDISSTVKITHEIPRASSTAKYRLKTAGTRSSSSTYTLSVFVVVPGSVVYLSIPSTGLSDGPSYQFQSTSSSVPTSGTNSYLVGTPYIGAVDTYVEVPSTANYLIVSQLTSNVSFKVKATAEIIDEISKITLPDESEYNIKDKSARQIIPYGSVDFDSTSTVLKATVDGITELRHGTACLITNHKIASAEGCTLNVNGLGGKPLYTTNAVATRVTTAFAASVTWMLVYNEHRVAGGCWDLVYLYNTNTTYSGMSEAEYNAGSSTTNRLISPANLKTGSSIWANGAQNAVKAKSAIASSDIIVGDANGYEKMLAGVEFDLAYPIMYANATVAADAVLSLGVREYYNKTLRTNLGDSWTGTAHLMVWLVGTLSSSNPNHFIIDANVVTQTIPSSNDGKYYLPLGILQSSGYQFAFNPKNELWAFRDGAFRCLSNVDTYTKSEIDTMIGDIETLLAAI